MTEISIFSTLLDTGDNVRIVIPNSQVYGDVIKNYSHNDTRRIDLVIGVGYGDNLSRASQIIEDVLKADSRVLPTPEYKVAVSELADSSVNFVVRPWCASGDYWALRWDLTRALKEKLEEGGCSIPFPQQDVHVLEFPGTSSAGNSFLLISKWVTRARRWGARANERVRFSRAGQPVGSSRKQGRNQRE